MLKNSTGTVSTQLINNMERFRRISVSLFDLAGDGSEVTSCIPEHIRCGGADTAGSERVGPVPKRLNLCQNVLQTYLRRLIMDGRAFGGEIHQTVGHTRKFLQTLFNPHGTGRAGHPFNGKQRVCRRAGSDRFSHRLRLWCIFYRHNLSPSQGNKSYRPYSPLPLRCFFYGHSLSTPPKES